MTREQIYTQQLQALGIYDPAFDPEIKQLSILERRKTRCEKAWSATAPPGGKPSFLDPHYKVITDLEDEILKHRTALGLTPAAMRKLRGVPGGEAPTAQTEISARLDRLLDRAGDYDAPIISILDAVGGGAADG